MRILLTLIVGISILPVAASSMTQGKGKGPKGCKPFKPVGIVREQTGGTSYAVKNPNTAVVKLINTEEVELGLVEGASDQCPIPGEAKKKATIATYLSVFPANPNNDPAQAMAAGLNPGTQTTVSPVTGQTVRLAGTTNFIGMFFSICAECPKPDAPVFTPIVRSDTLKITRAAGGVESFKRSATRGGSTASDPPATDFVGKCFEGNIFIDESTRGYFDATGFRGHKAGDQLGVNLTTGQRITTAAGDVIENTASFKIFIFCRKKKDDNGNGNGESAFIDVRPTSLTTSEDETQDTFEVVLFTQPTADVVVPLTVGDPSEGSIDPQSLTFTPANWDQPQTVTVFGIDDFDFDGDIQYSIQVGPATSGDPEYDGLQGEDVVVTNLDNEVPTITSVELAQAQDDDKVLVASVEFEVRIEITVGATEDATTGRVVITQAPKIECPVGAENKAVLDAGESGIINVGFKPQ